MTKKPFAMQWHITNKCDQRCKHCYIYEGKEKEVCLELNLEVLIKILENFINSCERLNVYPTIALTGGDPLLYKDFWGLLEAIKHYNISFSICTDCSSFIKNINGEANSCGKCSY